MITAELSRGFQQLIKSMRRYVRTAILFLLGAVRRLIAIAAFAVILGSLALFGLQYPHGEKLDALRVVVFLHRWGDPVLAEIGSYFALPWPAPTPSRIPLGVGFAIFLLKLVIDAIFFGGRRLVDKLLPARAATGGDEMAGVGAGSERSREELLKHYRAIEKALKTAKKRDCTFLSVDVVGSTQMKTGETEANIAATFQGYEEMLKRILQDHRAWKQSWTPDGVMICFLQAELAVEAAKRLLEGLEPFNETDNKLRTHFRVRCGVNQGEVAIFHDSQLEKVADHVIDVGGHMQKHASPDTIWLGEEVYNLLPDKSGFRPTDHVVDGYKVYEWSVESSRAVALTRASAAAPSPPPAEAKKPQRIGRYEILGEVGRGGMGVVFKAHDPQIARTVAIKIIPTTSLSSEELPKYKQRFFREAQAAGQLSHPNIITIYDVAEDESGQPYLVMEFVEAATLYRLMESTAGERLSLDQCLDIVIQVAEALDYAHQRGVIHRDIKPANILITSDGKAKITDFGIAKLAGTQLTQTGQILGTPAFMSPEQLTGATVDKRSDLFSLGTIFYWMCTGEKPFGGDTVTAIAFKVVQSTPIPARQLNPGLPAEVEGILSRALAKNPDERYPSCHEFAADLRALKEGRSLPSSTAAPAN